MSGRIGGRNSGRIRGWTAAKRRGRQGAAPCAKRSDSPKFRSRPPRLRACACMRAKTSCAVAKTAATAQGAAGPLLGTMSHPREALFAPLRAQSSLIVTWPRDLKASQSSPGCCATASCCTVQQDATGNVALLQRSRARKEACFCAATRPAARFAKPLTPRLGEGRGHACCGIQGPFQRLGEADDAGPLPVCQRKPCASLPKEHPSPMTERL